MAASQPLPPTGAATVDDPNLHHDPCPPVLREGDHFLLHFADHRQVFAQALPKWKCASFSPCKFNKRTYATHHLVGLPYGTVLEVGKEGLVPLPEGEGMLPGAPDLAIRRDVANGSQGAPGAGGDSNGDSGNCNGNGAAMNGAAASRNDNRNLVDDNTSQRLSVDTVQKLIDASTSGADVVAALISNSSTFEGKTVFSQAKYVKKKQLKYQPRCRIVRITPATLCAAMHLKDARKIGNLREDTLGQILSNANVCAGQRVLVADGAVQGLVTAGCVRRMGGYGTIISLYSGQQHAGYNDSVVQKMNLTVGERQSLKWVSIGEAFADRGEKARQTEALRDESGALQDVEQRDRDRIEWPTELQPHTRNYILNDLKDKRKIDDFLTKRCARFARKLTRPTALELRQLVDGCRDPEEVLDAEGNAKLQATEENGEADATTADSVGDDNGPRQCDSLVIATKYDPTTVLMRLLPYLAPSCPFVVYHEFMEPLLETFRTLQNYYDDHKCDDNEPDNSATKSNGAKTKTPKPMMLRRNIAINLRLTDTWFREYQVLEGRTHPNMTMSQNGGYILMGTKLCPRTGTNELDEETMREIRARVGGRRTQHKKKDNDGGDGGKKKKKRKRGDKAKEVGDGGEKPAKKS
ncbi:hypothetical protein ACHAXT_012153 [Thalassiosira profunda]